MLGVRTLITDRVFQRIGSKAYKKVLDLTWDAIEGDGRYGDIERPLNIVVLLGTDAEISGLDFTCANKKS